ncbi:hypothetical protein [Halospeciosus flavus]|uniref:hypothetical protein n=1 Tax=Halospeciosus flavus TaxID=3032283 RepID=UPI003608F3AE
MRVESCGRPARTGEETDEREGADDVPGRREFRDAEPEHHRVPDGEADGVRLDGTGQVPE